ncbi:hypothetical protein PF010_g5590 [Phytophthora fragariae]|uniref:Uncharacterized protein n=2 Tax=Phytophthora fragariae TaxID=53985 RepID=A0A6A3LRF6_9STRA|nr:hypothetical protein PF011_g5280 [Phytophthora fragariae]KAE9125537.1 hypothetical protein PF010_g5590 [Phytophthora fragariae]
MHTEPSADDAAPQPPYTDEHKPKAHTHMHTQSQLAPRVRTVRLTTRVHPELLVSYLYGERGGRGGSGIGAIMSATGCAIDYCALSPDEAERSPQTQAFVMNFLVSAASSEALEDATRQLRTLVDRVQTHLQKKARASTPTRVGAAARVQVQVDDARQFYDQVDAGRARRPSADAAASKREAIPDERWTEMDVEMGEEDEWSMQRVYYGPRRRRERPRYRDVTDVDADEKSEFVMPPRRPVVDAAAAEAAYAPRNEPPTHFVARRRVRRYPDHARWAPRNYPAQMRETAYPMYAVPSPHGQEQGQRLARSRPRHIYQAASNHFAQAEYSPYDYGEEGEDSEADFVSYTEAVDLTNENAGANDSSEFADVPKQHQPVHQPRRSLKRPLGKMRSEGPPPPPPIYRQRMPYIYDYVYDDEDDEWMTDDEEMAVAYGYPPPYRHVEFPVVRRRRRFDSVSSQQWSSPAGPGHQRMYKRRRIPRDEPPLEYETNDDDMVEAPNPEHVIRPTSGGRMRTAFMDQLNEVAESTTGDTSPGRDESHVEAARVPTDDVPSPSETHSDNAELDGGNREYSHADETAGAEKQDELLTGQSVSIENCGSIERVCQNEVVPLDASASAEDAVGYSSPRSGISASSPPRKTAEYPPDEEERRIASPPSSAANNVASSVERLDSCLDKMVAANGETLEQQVEALQNDLEHVLSMDKLRFDRKGGNIETVTITSDKKKAPAKICIPPPISTENQVNTDEGGDMDWDNDGWFEEPTPNDPAVDSDDQENFVAQISPKKSNLKFGGDFLAVKLEEGASLRWPRELPPFIWSLLARVITSDPQTYVMRVTHKRLMDEIAKGDPYYYLHPTILTSNADGSSLLRSSPARQCEFGCRGASALKWERKLVSQISSRMKSFDNVAYSLARSSGGKEVLNRKKMNSIIRKLHLVAMQLHSLVSHLYCVKGQTTCKEIDSLPIALNNSHFERKMGVYKSRLKLVVPHKYQQQQQSPQQQQLNSANEPAEELLRDTYEFFPELLLCVDIWGYNYREGQAKRHNSKSVLGENHSGVVSEGALFPLGFFRGVEILAFDFEHDSNGLLRCICDELLNIVCLWNDFKWTDNLEAVALERVVSFETDVTASILKILELYAHHLQALWAVRLLDEPDQLRSVHFTQFNAYYSDRSQGGLNPSSGAQSRAPTQSKSSGDGLNRDPNTVDRLVADEIVEQRLAEEYWNRKVTALSIHNPIEDATDEADPKPSQLMSAETICAWDQQTLVSYLLRWSDVYSIRGEVNALSAVTNHMLKHEVQKYRLSDSTCDTDQAVIDTATRHLLAAVSRAQMLIRDALVGTEKLALHSASSQLPDERKHVMYSEDDVEASEASKANPGARSSSAQRASSCQTTEDSPSRQADEPPSAPAADTADERKTHSASTARNAVGVQEEITVEAGISVDQPELKDLIQLLAVTKQDMQELCGHRPRSARMREKVQTQSLQLARQTVEIFRNIKNMGVGVLTVYSFQILTRSTTVVLC